MRFLALFFFLGGMTLGAFAQHPKILDRINNMSVDTMWNHLDDLQHIERRAPLDDWTATNYLLNKLQQYQLDSLYIQDFDAQYMPNIIAIKRGKVYPDSLVVIGAHYDVVLPPPSGADDNASGTAALLEMIRVYDCMHFEKTQLFVFFSMEENAGNPLGSAYLADSLANINAEMAVMMNLDGISYQAPGFDTLSHNIGDNGPVAKALAWQAQYVPELQSVQVPLPFGASSDHVPFQNEGFPGLMYIAFGDLFSPEFNIHMHTASDTIGTSANNPWKYLRISRSAAATLAEYSVPLSNGDVVITNPQHSAELLCIADADSIHWYHCNGDSVIPGATGTIFAGMNYNLVNEDFAAIMYNNGCADTSACMMNLNWNVEEHYFAARPKVYPHPITNEATLAFESNNNESLTFQLYDVKGELLRTAIGIRNAHTIQRNGLSSGIYFFELLADGKVVYADKLVFR